MSLRLGYGTNGFANHRLDDALAIIAELGYAGVALTLDHAHLDPYGPELDKRIAHVRDLLARHRLAVVIETGARFLLDPEVKHAPTLLDDARERRIDFLRRSVDVAAELDAEAVSFWAGIRPAHVDPRLAHDRLVGGCARVVEHAAAAGVTLGFEPEPGMLVETLAQWLDLHGELGEPSCFGLTLDIGHCRAIEPLGVADCVRIAGPYLVNVQIDDMCRGVHEHLEFGDGEIDFPPVLAALTEVGYPGLVAVELPRHSHAAPQVAARSIAFLREAQPREAQLGTTGEERAVTLSMTMTLALQGAVGKGSGWLGEARTRVAADPGAIRSLLPAVGRQCGRDAPLTANGWRSDDAARVLLLTALPLRGSALVDEVCQLYRYGDADEKRAVLRALPWLEIGDGCVELLRDALRTNDTRLVAAALGPYAENLDDAAWRQGVLKCVFMRVPLSVVDDLHRRADPELAVMLTALLRERLAAGRTIPDDAMALLHSLTPEKVV